MTEYTLIWPPEFEEFSWELKSKGWFCELIVLVDGKYFKPCFYDKSRLLQDIDEELSGEGRFSVQNLIVIDVVSRESMESAIHALAKTGELNRWVEEKEPQERDHQERVSPIN